MDGEHSEIDVDVDAMLSAILEDDSPRSLPVDQIFGQSVLVKAFAAALSEYKAYADAAPGLPPVLDREAQLMASPLWYAPPAPPRQTESKKRSYEAMNGIASTSKAPPSSRPQEVEEEAVEDAEEEDTSLLLDKHEYLGEEVDPEEVEEGEPYFNPDDYEPVSPRLQVHAEPLDELVIPDPPPIEQAIPQDPTLLHPATAQEALQSALNAWYTAGYAAAVYHMKSGMMPPSTS